MLLLRTRLVKRNCINSGGLVAFRLLKAALFLALVFSCVSCSVATRNNFGSAELFVAPPAADPVVQAATPVFLIHEADKAYNRIGAPRVRGGAGGGTEVYVDPARAALFIDRRSFGTVKGAYENLIFRVHFEKVPFSLREPHLGAGNNPGLIVVVTLDQEGVPVLVTTVHTCGCYLAFIPTDSLPPDALPLGWPAKSQTVYGKKLPAVIATPVVRGDSKIIIVIDSGTHRVDDVKLTAMQELAALYPRNTMDMLPMEALWSLPFAGREISFFEREGCRKGYVKNSAKPLERLLMSWWTFDWHIGEDKAYGNSEEVGARFYTSLKFWRRKDSDMWNFAHFLKFWGWRL